MPGCGSGIDGIEGATAAVAAASAGNGQARHQAEPEARLIRTPYHGFEVAYNAQTVVDARHKLIVAFMCEASFHIFTA